MSRNSYRFAAAIAAVGVSVLAAPAAHAAPTALDGLFALTPGVCANGVVTGSFFRMILPTGDASGPYLQNSDSRCSDQTVTPLSAGTDGGLVSGSYQPQPATAFDGAGNAQSGRVTTPVRFYGVDFATATNPTDPQTGAATALPRLFSDGGRLSGDLSSLGVTWNNQVFNQGSPKPGGGLPGKTGPISGSIDQAGNYVIEWTSQIVGGPFNNFTGLWHLAGHYQGTVPQAAPAAAPIAAPPAASARESIAPQAPSSDAPGAAQAPAAAPPAAGAPQNPVAPQAPASAPAGAPNPGGVAPQTVQAAPALATKTVDIPRGQPNSWLVPVLLIVAVAGTAVFFTAGRLVRIRR
ncbi:hypothetical protein ACIP5Y_05400 [Nocardia sp. NPDC088792]|uniref:hypothetical protein n=1 Tax=Nocardia sp. NPDC088792 TaxID=3364332 RepID=UPI0037FA04C1